MNGFRRCAFSIEKEWPGHRVVLSRRQCKNKVKPPYRYCHVHRYKETPAASSAGGGT